MRAFHKACEVVIFIGVVNFLLFFLISVFIGGSAINGKAENGHYYFAHHGLLTEVSALVFGYSQFHFYSILVTWPLLGVASVSYRLTGGEDTLPAVKIYGIWFPRYLIVVMVTIPIVILVVFVVIFLSLRR